MPIRWQGMETISEGEMNKPIPELPFDVEVAECQLMDALNNQSERNLFDAILQHYLNELAILNKKLEWYRNLDNRRVLK